MSARADLARRVLLTLVEGKSVPTQEAFQLRNWANSPDDAMLSLEEIAHRILIQEEESGTERFRSAAGS
jgi:hypothetical protein